MDLTGEERKFIRRNLEDGSKLIIDGDVQALYMAMLRWADKCGKDKKGDITPEGNRAVEMAGEIRERHNNPNRPKKAAKPLKVTEEERKFIVRKVLLGEKDIREGNLNVLGPLKKMVQEDPEDCLKPMAGDPIMAMVNAIYERNTRPEDWLDVTEEERAFFRENYINGIQWICYGDLEGVDLHLYWRIRTKGTDDDGNLTPEGERLHQMHEAILARNAGPEYKRFEAQEPTYAVDTTGWFLD